jgi:glycosyltransferase involved in cell wall biosynthesis
MRIAMINMTCAGSTGSIMLQIARTARDRGHEVMTFSPVEFSRGKGYTRPQIPGHHIWGSRLEGAVHNYVGVALGLNGLLSRRGTRALVRKLEQFRPDVVHLHNLHRFCVHFPTLMKYLKRNRIPVVWTLHDCWTFTGKCPHFDMVGCQRWKTGCGDCPQLRSYPKAFCDTSKMMYRKKKEWFAGLEDLTLVTPSRWLAELAGQSFLKDKPVRVINNGIDLSVFHPLSGDLRQRYGWEGKHLLLGVAFGWSRRKGLDVFVELARRLGEGYQILLVGTDETVDAQLPENIATIHRTADRQELAAIYSAADLFVNPTREENFPTVNMEALACGTPVLTFRTGGSPEIVGDRCGCAVDRDDLDGLEAQIRRICTERPYDPRACVAHARNFRMEDRFEEYIELYEDIAHRPQRPL